MLIISDFLKKPKPFWDQCKYFGFELSTQCPVREKKFCKRKRKSLPYQQNIIHVMSISVYLTFIMYASFFLFQFEYLICQIYHDNVNSQQELVNFGSKRS